MTADNHIYYFEIGQGKWEGRFSLQLNDWRSFWRDPIGLRNRFLVFSMLVFQKLTGKSTINSEIKAHPGEGRFGVATNVVRIYHWMTLYLLREKYVLDPDGSEVMVISSDHFGPFSFLFRDSMEYSAVIHQGGTSSTYYMPLLGTNWVCDYQVQPDHNHVDAVLRCAWAEAHEMIQRAS